MEVNEIDEVLRTVERLGGKTIVKQVTFPNKRPSAHGHGSVTFAYFADPEGNIAGLCKGIVRP